MARLSELVINQEDAESQEQTQSRLWNANRKKRRGESGKKWKGKILGRLGSIVYILDHPPDFFQKEKKKPE